MIRLLIRLKRVKYFNPEEIEIPDVARDDRQTVHGCCRCDHGVFDQPARLAVHETGPFPEYAPVQCKNIVSLTNQRQPFLQFRSLDGILLARDFDTSLNFSDGDRRKMQIAIVCLVKPLEHRAVRFVPTEFGNHIGIQKIHLLKNIRPIASL